MVPRDSDSASGCAGMVSSRRKRSPARGANRKNRPDKTVNAATPQASHSPWLVGQGKERSIEAALDRILHRLDDCASAKSRCRQTAVSADHISLAPLSRPAEEWLPGAERVDGCPHGKIRAVPTKGGLGRF